MAGNYDDVFTLQTYFTLLVEDSRDIDSRAERAIYNALTDFVVSFLTVRISLLRSTHQSGAWHSLPAELRH